MVYKRTKGDYPAQGFALDLILNSNTANQGNMAKREAKAVAELATGEISKSLINIFFESNRAKKSFPLDDKENKIEFNINSKYWTSANWDHKAFTYFPSKGYLALPVSWFTKSEQHSNLLVFKVSTDKMIQEIGEVDMSGVNVNHENGSHHWRAKAIVSRSIFATSNDKSYVYALSDFGIISGLIKDESPSSIEKLSVVDLPYAPHHGAPGIPMPAPAPFEPIHGNPIAR